MLRGMFSISRGVTRLDGARGKKQVWRPSVRTWPLSEGIYCIEENTRGIFCDFSVPTQWFGAQEIVPPYSPLVTPVAVSAISRSLVIIYQH